MSILQPMLEKHMSLSGVTIPPSEWHKLHWLSASVHRASPANISYAAHGMDFFMLTGELSPIDTEHLHYMCCTGAAVLVQRCRWNAVHVGVALKDGTLSWESWVLVLSLLLSAVDISIWFTAFIIERELMLCLRRQAAPFYTHVHWKVAQGRFRWNWEQNSRLSYDRAKSHSCCLLEWICQTCVLCYLDSNHSSNHMLHHIAKIRIQESRYIPLLSQILVRPTGNKLKCSPFCL